MKRLNIFHYVKKEFFTVTRKNPSFCTKQKKKKTRRGFDTSRKLDTKMSIIIVSESLITFRISLILFCHLRKVSRILQ